MPDPEGFAGVSEQLRAVRQRANRLVFIDAACGAAAALALLASAVIAAAVWGSGGVFQLVTGVTIGGAAAAVAAAVVYARRHWLDFAAAARVADRRAQLADRLTTITVLSPAGDTSPLFPLLIAQTVDLRERWRPAAVIPRRLPRTAAVLLAALGVLGAVLLWPRVQPLASLTVARLTPTPNPAARSAITLDRPLPLRHLAQRDRPDDTSVPQASTPGRGDIHDAADPGDTEQGAAAHAEESTTTPLLTLPQQLQHAIRAAVQGETAGRPQSLAGATIKPPAAGTGARSRTGEPEPGSEKNDPGQGKRQDVAAGHGKDPGGKPAKDAETHSPEATNQDAATRPARSDEAGREEDAQRSGEAKPRGGAAPPAGGGSRAGNLLAQKPGGAAPETANAPAFKVTITSFLKSLEQNPSIPPPAGRRTRAGAEARPAPALSDTQLADDLLRKAEVPPEYEDLVRRVYSTREEP